MRGRGAGTGRSDADVLGGGSDELVAAELADVLLGNGLLLGVVGLGVGAGRDDVDLGDVRGDNLNAGLVLVGEVEGGTAHVVELDVGDVSGGLNLELLAVDGLDGGNDVREDEAEVGGVVCEERNGEWCDRHTREWERVRKGEWENDTH